MDEITIGIIIILYKIDIVEIASRFSESNVKLIVVDNTPGQVLRIGNGEDFFYLPLKANLGIAEAQNRGIEVAIKQGCSHVVFLDQDSIIDTDYPKRIVNEYIRIENKVPNLFLLGPTVFNGRTKSEYKSTLHKDNPSEFDFIPRREVISSGSCVSIEKIKKVGVLDSRLFIDYVDFEWCWRANAMGFQSGITNKIKISHFVGNTEYWFMGQLVIISSPTRYFYQTRNYIWLLKSKYVPFNWKINNGVKRFIFSLTYPFKVKEWREIYNNIQKGFLAGIKY